MITVYLIHVGDDASNEETLVTAIIKVKNSPGALWKALDKIGVSI